MAEFPTAVQPPGGASYAPPLMNFSNFSNWAADDPYKLPTEKARLDQIQQQIELSKAFAGGLPTDPQTGQIDYRKAAGILAAKGDIGGAVSLLQQQPAPLPQILGGGQPQGGQPQGQPQAQPAPQVAPQGQPASVQARPLPPPGRGPQGDAGTGTVTSMVTDRLPAQNQTTGETIMKIAQVMGIDPNANLTPGQVVRAQGLLKKYAPEIAGSGALSFSDRFRGDSGGDQGGGLPPSANAGTPAATAAPPAQGARPQGGQPAAQQPQAQPQAQAQGQPLVPQEPLPPGYTDPVKAIADLRIEANRLAADPRPNAQAMAQRADAWAGRIEAGLKPVSVGTMSTLLDPRDQHVLYQGPGAAAYRGPGGEAGKLVAMENAERADRGERPMTAQEEVSFIQGIRPPRSSPAMAVDAFKREFQHNNGRAPTAEEITKFAANYSREQSYGRAAGGQGARVENAANEVVQLIPQAVEASKNLPRGKWVKWNELVQKWDQGTSDPAYNDFMMANFGLLNAYTRAMNPQGVPRIQERLEQHAMGVLSTANDEKAFEVQIRRLWKEVQASKTATAETAKGVTPGDINAPVPGLDNPATKSSGSSTTFQNTTPDGFGWSIEK